ncbi:MAG: signal recognition particle protein [Rickettsiaceae bacterium]|jgi:signal recognition particle subunit SRP54|nr:signal recognition particle protein [Rickettsiaceae bacterium]
MFESLSDNLNKVFSRLKSKGVLTEDDVNTAMREVRVALLEADVSLSVAKDFIAKVKEKAIGSDVVKSISPGQMVVKIVQDNLEQMLGSDESEINLNAVPPAVIMMIGLQGSGKTTSSGKLANFLNKKRNKKILLASLDIYRPAAQEQLEILGKQIVVDSLPIIKEEKPVAITKRAMEQGKLGGYDVVILDTAGRLHIDEELMQELQKVKEIAKPVETLLVADSLTGQDAVNIASQFNEKVGITGIILTRIDGDGRGGAALSMRAVTGCPIKFMGVGERISEFEAFHPNRIASRILGMGDVVSLVERAMENVDIDEAQKMESKIRKGQFDMNDLSKQLKMMRKMGGIGGLVGMIPGIGKMKKEIEESGVDDRLIIRQEAMISSMTKKERRNPGVINASRKKRIAAGAGVSVQDLNRLLKQHLQMATMMKKLGRMDKKTLMRGGLGKLMPKLPGAK